LPKVKSDTCVNRIVFLYPMAIKYFKNTQLIGAPREVIKLLTSFFKLGKSFGAFGWGYPSAILVEGLVYWNSRSPFTAYLELPAEYLKPSKKLINLKSTDFKICPTWLLISIAILC